MAISGSLRAASTNSRLLQAMALLAPDGVRVSVYDGLAELPHFNPDLDNGPPHPAVAAFRDQLRNADGVAISSPEYAHGVPGSLKNALDWVVASGELVGKPVALISASTRSTYAQAALAEILRTMSAGLVVETSVPLLGSTLTPQEIASHPEFAENLRGTLEAFQRLPTG